MSVEESAYPEDDARKEAERILRFKIGPQYSLGERTQEGKDHVFPITIRRARVIFDEIRQNPVDVNYLPRNEVGEIRIPPSGDADYTHPRTVYKRVRDIEQEIQERVEKALISSSAKDFTKLPFPENRYAPVEDLLSELILSGSISIERLKSLQKDEDGDGKYVKYLDELVAMELIYREDGNLKPGRALSEFQVDEDRGSDALNAALAYYFENKIDDMGAIHGVLGPYLAIAGFYYRLAIESDQLPVVSESELREAFERHYRGQGRRKEQKKFKMSRYLLHLERAGILKARTKSDGRQWYGDSDLKNDLQDTEYVAMLGSRS